MDFLHLKMELIGCPETSVWNYHFTLRKIPKNTGLIDIAAETLNQEI
jgi:hypothetical protein